MSFQQCLTFCMCSNNSIRPFHYVFSIHVDCLLHGKHSFVESTKTKALRLFKCWKRSSSLILFGASSYNQCFRHLQTPGTSLLQLAGLPSQSRTNVWYVMFFELLFHSLLKCLISHSDHLSGQKCSRGLNMKNDLQVWHCATLSRA